jgi:hypothetical protein
VILSAKYEIYTFTKELSIRNVFVGALTHDTLATTLHSNGK